MSQQQFKQTVTDEFQWNLEQLHTDEQYAKWCEEVNAKINAKLTEEKNERNS